MQNVEQVIILGAILCTIIGTIAAIIRMAVKRTVEKNILTYIALRASALILQGRVLLWDDLMQLYEIDIKSLLETSGTLTYEEGQYTLILVKKFLTRYAPPERSEEWQKSLQKARRSIPHGGTRRPMCIPGEGADSFMGCLLLIGIAGLLGFTVASASPSWLIIGVAIIPVVLSQLFLIITTVRMLRWTALLAQATKERKKSIFHSLALAGKTFLLEQTKEKDQEQTW